MLTNLYVKLTGSDNKYITYPAYGLLQILEFGITGSVISAAFRVAVNGKLSAPVEVGNPKFQYSPKVARAAHPIVAELFERQRSGDESRNYRHKIIELVSGDVLEICDSRLSAELFCHTHDLRIKQNNVYPDKGLVHAHVYPTIGTKTLAAIYSILCNDEASSDDQLFAHFQTFGLTESQARVQVARRAAALKAPL